MQSKGVFPGGQTNPPGLHGGRPGPAGCAGGGLQLAVRRHIVVCRRRQPSLVQRPPSSPPHADHRDRQHAAVPAVRHLGDRVPAASRPEASLSPPAGTGSGTGIADAATGTVNIGASDAYLSSADMTQYPGLLNIPLAMAASQVNYNLPGVEVAQAERHRAGRDLHAARSPPGTTRRSPAEPGRDAAEHEDHHAAPRGQLGRHVPVHLLPERPGPERVDRRQRQHHGHLAQRRRARWPRPATAAWWPAARPTRAASPTSASATCPRPRRPGLGEPRSSNKAGNYVQPTAATIAAGAASVHRQDPGQRGACR